MLSFRVAGMDTTAADPRENCPDAEKLAADDRTVEFPYGRRRHPRRHVGRHSGSPTTWVRGRNSMARSGSWKRPRGSTARCRPIHGHRSATTRDRAIPAPAERIRSDHDSTGTVQPRPTGGSIRQIDRRPWRDQPLAACRGSRAFASGARPRARPSGTLFPYEELAMKFVIDSAGIASEVNARAPWERSCNRTMACFWQKPSRPLGPGRGAVGCVVPESEVQVPATRRIGLACRPAAAAPGHAAPRPARRAHRPHDG